MDADDLDDRKPPADTACGRDLALMSIDALEDYIRALETEIARARATIADKRKARAGADALFRR